MPHNKSQRENSQYLLLDYFFINLSNNWKMGLKMALSNRMNYELTGIIRIIFKFQNIML